MTTNSPIKGLLLTLPLNGRLDVPERFQHAQMSVPELTAKIQALSKIPHPLAALNQLTLEFIGAIGRGMYGYYQRDQERPDALPLNTPTYVLLDIPQYATPVFHQALTDSGLGVAYYLHPKRLGMRQNYQLYLYPSNPL